MWERFVYLRLLDLDALHALEGVIQGVSALAETLRDTSVFLLIKLIAGLPLDRRVDHALEQALCDDRRAQANADKLVDLLLDQRIEANELEVTTAVAALTDHTLGDTVQRDQLDVVVLTGLLLLQLAQALLEGDELALEDVGLVDLVGNNDQTLLSGDIKDLLDVVGAQGGSGRVTRVDDDNGTHVDRGGLGLLDRLEDRIDVGSPGLLLFEEIRHAAGVQQGEGCGIERVLRDRDQNTGAFVVTDDAQESADTGRGTSSQEQVLGVGREAVAVLDELGDAVPDTGSTLAVTVGTDALHIGEQDLGTLNNILLVSE
jgi:hypothetical protein